jgi:hypothetical protein
LSAAHQKVRGYECRFLFVPADRVIDVAKKEGAIAFDAPGAESRHFVKDGKAS